MMVRFGRGHKHPLARSSSRTPARKCRRPRPQRPRSTNSSSCGTVSKRRSRPNGSFSVECWMVRQQHASPAELLVLMPKAKRPKPERSGLPSRMRMATKQSGSRQKLRTSVTSAAVSASRSLVAGDGATSYCGRSSPARTWKNLYPRSSCQSPRARPMTWVRTGSSPPWMSLMLRPERAAGVR
ncbi:hypothetical protein D3C72_1331100 [compost metagenome]